MKPVEQFHVYNSVNIGSEAALCTELGGLFQPRVTGLRNFVSAFGCVMEEAAAANTGRERGAGGADGWSWPLCREVPGC